MSIRGTFSQKYADYVFTDTNLKVIAIVELDLRTHKVDRDRTRDDMLSQASYTVIRWTASNKPTIEMISQRFALLRPPKPSEPLPPAQSAA